MRQMAGMKRLPSVPTISRMLEQFDERSLLGLEKTNAQLVLPRLQAEGWARITLDFDGSVLSARRQAEGTGRRIQPQKERAASAVTTRSFAPWGKPDKSQRYCIAAAACMTPTEPSSSCAAVCKRCGKLCPQRRRKPAWTAVPFSAMRWFRRWKP